MGAYVTPEMIKAMYNALDTIPKTMFPFSSRGPAPDGHRGVNIVAPGAAITGIPKCSLLSNYMANGTSMASPNAVGSVGKFFFVLFYFTIYLYLKKADFIRMFLKLVNAKKPI